MRKNKGAKLKNKLAIFASGAGSNAQAIIDYFKSDEHTEIECIVCNKKTAGVFSIAQKENIHSLLVSKNELENPNELLPFLKDIDYIILAGFLLKIPEYLIHHFRDKIINIHPALLPKYGGKGMYGMHVHQAVKDAGEIETGITIHLVDEIYDNGEHIAQFSVGLNGTETVQEIANKVHKLEHQHFPPTIQAFIEG